LNFSCIGEAFRVFFPCSKAQTFCAHNIQKAAAKNRVDKLN